MKIFAALCLLLFPIAFYAYAQADATGETGAVVLYTAIAASTPDRQNIATVSMTAQAFANEASCRNAQEWFKRQALNNPLYGITTNSWCTIKVPY